MRIKDLKPDSRNTNKGTAKGQKMIIRSIQEDGFGRSALLDKNNQIIAGNKTTEAAAEVFGVDVEPIIIETDGKRPVYVKRTDLDLDDPHGAARRLAYRDNLSSHFSFDLDPAQVMADIESGFDFEAIDVGLADLGEMLGKAADELLNGDKAGADTEPQTDKAEELRVKWGVESGQMWQLGEHRIICGDCTDPAVVARVMGGERAALCVTDPPYGIGADKKNAHSSIRDNPAWRDLDWDKRPDPQHIKMIANFAEKTAIWGGNYFTDSLAVSSGWLAWVKPQYGTGFSLADMELCWTNQDIGARCKDFPRRDGNDHPTQKPVKLIEWTIEKIDKDLSGIVIDFYSGSGTTIIACENLSRRCRAIEIDAGYVAVAIERWAAHTGKTPVVIPQSIAG